MSVDHTFHVMIGIEVEEGLYGYLLGLEDPDLYTNPWPNQPVYVTSSSMGIGPTILGIDLVTPMSRYDEDRLYEQNLDSINLDEAKELVQEFAAKFGYKNVEPKLLSFVEAN